jgi:hypothetical protein
MTDYRGEAGHDTARFRLAERGLFYLGLGLLFTHEMDAMSNHEWRVMPLLNALPDPTGKLVFLVAHVPLFAIVIAFVASAKPRTRRFAESVTCGFMLFHAALHYVFAGHPAYEFSSLTSELLIVGAAMCGLSFFAVRFLNRHTDSI